MSRPVAARGSFSASSVDGSSTRGSSWGGSSECTLDTLEDLARRFTLDVRSPELALKVRGALPASAGCLGGLVLGADAGYGCGAGGGPRAALVLKPARGASAWWRRARLAADGTLTLRSRRLRWWVLSLFLEGHANGLPGRRAADVSFRVATKWDAARGELRSKRLVPLDLPLFLPFFGSIGGGGGGAGGAGAGASGSAAAPPAARAAVPAEARVHYTVSYHLPEVAGSLGAGAGGARSRRELRADVGYAHAALARLELVAWPWGGRPGDEDDAVAPPVAPAAAAPRAVEAEAAAVEKPAAPAGPEPPALDIPGGGGGRNRYLPSYLTEPGEAAAGGARRGAARPPPSALGAHIGALRDGLRVQLADIFGRGGGG